MENMEILGSPQDISMSEKLKYGFNTLLNANRGVDMDREEIVKVIEEINKWLEAHGFKEIIDIASVTVINDRLFINATPHTVRFEDGSWIHGSVSLAKILSAKRTLKLSDEVGELEFYKVMYEPTELGKEFLSFIGLLGYDLDVVIHLITSTISAQAYKSPLCVVPVVTPETERLPPIKRVCYKNRWIIY